jgi:hypothetical protein|tara:strand:- start:24 stop:182 length:159 start_codon:yes stop_codon:yes gene_type:complete
LIEHIEFLWHSVPQPWQAQSGCKHDAGMAAAILGRANIGAYISQIYVNQTDF